MGLTRVVGFLVKMLSNSHKYTIFSAHFIHTLAPLNNCDTHRKIGPTTKQLCLR